MNIKTTNEMKQSIDECHTKSILESDLTHLEIQKEQINSNIKLVKEALKNPETDEEFNKRTGGDEE